jgi:hypothetical protein
MKKSEKAKMVLEAHKPKKFEIPKFVYAVIWKHANGWTFDRFVSSPEEAHEWHRKYNPSKAMHDWRMIPCEVSPTLKSLLKKFGYMQ